MYKKTLTDISNKIISNYVLSNILSVSVVTGPHFWGMKSIWLNVALYLHSGRHQWPTIGNHIFTNTLTYLVRCPYHILHQKITEYVTSSLVSLSFPIKFDFSLCSRWRKCLTSSLRLTEVWHSPDLVVNSHFCKRRSKSGNRGWLEKRPHSGVSWIVLVMELFSRRR